MAEDVRVTMPPMPLRYEGRAALAPLLARAFGLDILRIESGAIAETTTFGNQQFPAFNLPTVLEVSGG